MDWIPWTDGSDLPILCNPFLVLYECVDTRPHFEPWVDLGIGRRWNDNRDWVHVESHNHEYHFRADGIPVTLPWEKDVRGFRIIGWFPIPKDNISQPADAKREAADAPEGTK